MTTSSTDLAQEIAELRQEVKVLRQVLDEIRAELSWANNNAQDLAGGGAMNLVRRITSMSADPTARDFHVNDVDDAILSKLRDEAPDDGNSRVNDQRHLF